MLREEIDQIAARIAPYIRETPVERSDALSAASGAEVFIKLENFQVTGSFKVRGALSRLSAMTSDERGRGVVGASSGNHGAALAYGARRLEIPAVVFVPDYADPSKVAAIQRYGAEVRVHGSDCVDTERYARKWAAERGRVYVSPYNDPHVVRGQGTLGVEIRNQLGPIDAVFIAVGGGGLIAGVGAYLKTFEESVEMVACSPARSPAMHACLEAGAIIDVPCESTWSDATAGGVEAGAVTFEWCQRVVDRSLLVSEEAISSAMRDFLDQQHALIEGAAGVALAGFQQTSRDYAGKRVVIVLCGANIGIQKLADLLLNAPS